MVAHRVDDQCSRLVGNLFHALLYGVNASYVVSGTNMRLASSILVSKSSAESWARSSHLCRSLFSLLALSSGRPDIKVTCPERAEYYTQYLYALVQAGGYVALSKKAMVHVPPASATRVRSTNFLYAASSMGLRFLVGSTSAAIVFVLDRLLPCLPVAVFLEAAFDADGLLLGSMT
jgi:hypothetical protein